MSGDIPPWGPVLGFHITEGLSISHCFVSCSVCQLLWTVLSEVSFTLCTAKREPQKHLKVPWKSSLWSLPGCTYHFLFVQTSVEAVWNTLLFFFFFLAHSTIPFISIFSLEFAFACFSPELACLLLKPEVLSLQYWSKSPTLDQFQDTELVFLNFFFSLLSCQATAFLSRWHIRVDRWQLPWLLRGLPFSFLSLRRN